MKILNSLRYIGWLGMENLKADSVTNRLSYIHKVMSDDEFYKKEFESKLQKLLSYSTQHVNYYRPYKTDGTYRLEDFPVINKNLIMSNTPDFHSDEFNHDNLHEMSTSGSTGRPFKITQNGGKRKQVLAEILYFSGLLGYKPGKKFVYLRNLEPGFSKSKFKQFLQNEDVIFTRKYDNKTLSDIVNKLKSLENETTILGYASTLQVLANYMHANDIKLHNIKGIISGAEAITSKTRKLVSQQFGCPVVSRYSNQEMGILAQDNVEDHFLLNRVSYYLEILAMDSNDPVKDGEMGRIVVTDLYNYATPLVRYDTGDMGIMKRTEDGRPYLAKVCGRKLDLLYTTKNEPISFFALDHLFETNYDIEQYQIIQNDRYHFILNLLMKEGKTVDEAACIKGMQSVLGADCKVTVNYLETVPITASGKFRYVICNYTPNV